MQTKQTTGLRTAARDYETLVQQACNKVKGFSELYKEMDRSISITGKSKSTLTNYGRHLASMALHYGCMPTELAADQVMDYLHLVKANGSPSATYFKFTIYGLRFACKLRGLPYHQFSLPAIEKADKLPVVLSQTEVKQLLKASDLLKHRILIGLVYGCGLRCAEVRKLAIRDADLQRGMLHVRQGKGGKDRYVPLGKMLIRALHNTCRQRSRNAGSLKASCQGPIFTAGYTMDHQPGSKEGWYPQRSIHTYFTSFLCYAFT